MRVLVDLGSGLGGWQEASARSPQAAQHAVGGLPGWLAGLVPPIFKELDLPYVSPHSARHSFISMLQERGVPVGLVAKLAGHSNATVTLGHYTQAIGGGEAAVAALQGAYDGR